MDVHVLHECSVNKHVLLGLQVHEMLYEMNDVSEMPSSAAAAAAAARGRTTLSPTHDVTADTDSSHSDSGKGPSEEGDSQQLHDVSHDSQMAPQTFAMSIFNAKHNDNNSRAHARINKPSIHRSRR